MAINNALIKEQISALIDQTKGLEQAQSQEVFSQQLANIIQAAIVSATVTIAPGIAVQVAVPAGTGSTIANGIGTLS